MYDGDFLTHVKVGDFVQHCNTGGQWGRVLRVWPQNDRTLELQIEGICRPGFQWDDPSVRWWASYRIINWLPTYGPLIQDPKENVNA